MQSRPKVTRRKVIQGAAAVAVASALPRVAFASSPAPVTLNVTTTTGPAVSPNFLGLSSDKSYLSQTCSVGKMDDISCFSKNNTGLVQMYQLLAAKYTNTTPFQPVLRFGANGVDLCNWNGLGINATYSDPSEGIKKGAYNTETNYVDDLAGFLKATGWLCLYGVNLANVNALTGASAGEDNGLSATEVKYVANSLGIYNAQTNPSGSLLAIEIGNEPDDYVMNGVFSNTPPNSWTESDNYFHLWGDYLYAILEAVSDIPISATAAGGSGHQSAWNETFLTGTDPVQNSGPFKSLNSLSLITQHYYRGAGDNIDGKNTPATCQSLCSDDPQFRAEYQNKYNFDYNGTEVTGLAYWVQQAGTLPWRIGECNSYYGDTPPNVLYSFAAALWALDLCINAANLGAQGINLHGTGLPLGYQPIQDSGGYVEQALPSFYGLLFFAMTGIGTTYTTNFGSPTTLPTIPGSNPAQTVNVSSYAVLNKSGTQWSVVINNKDVVSLEVTINLPGSAPTSAGKYEMTAAGGITQHATQGVYDQFVTINGFSVKVTLGESVAFAPGAPSTNGVNISGNTVTTEVFAEGAVLVVINV